MKDIWEILVLFLQFLCKCEIASRREVTQKGEEITKCHPAIPPAASLAKTLKTNQQNLILRFSVCSGKSSLMTLHNHLH